MQLQDIIADNLIFELDSLRTDLDLTKQIQTRLSALGLLQFSDVDGLFGPMTEAALTRFCDAVHLDNMATRKLGPTFAKKLIEARGIPSDIPGDNTPIPGGNGSVAFAKALEFTLPAEGGQVDNPVDPGGRTNKGIIQSVYNHYRSQKGLPNKDVFDISDAEVGEIYFTMYWKPAQCDVMTLPLAVVHFDTAVNFGVRGSIQFLQEALGLSADGIFGPQTQGHLQSNNNKATAKKMVVGRIAYRHQRVAENPSQEIFLQGWLNRDNGLMQFIQPLPE
ncbi:MAG: glycosyl hydrolase 108 family protein [Thermosynechococcaceae cyanobacterium]